MTDAARREWAHTLYAKIEAYCESEAYRGRYADKERIFDLYITALADAERAGMERAAGLCETAGTLHPIEWWQSATKREVSAQTARDMAVIIRAKAQAGEVG